MDFKSVARRNRKIEIFSDKMLNGTFHTVTSSINFFKKVREFKVLEQQSEMT